MKVAIIQSNYIPWRGYFDIIDDVDIFIVHDDLQYTKGDWRNRNKIKTANGTKWLSVPVNYRHEDKQLIMEATIDYQHGWVHQHVKTLKQAYAKAPYLKPLFEELETILKQKYTTISQLNIALIRWMMEKLEIRTKLLMSWELEPSGAKTERVISLLRAVSASTYLSGPAAADYLDIEAFRENGIGLEYKSYAYPPYSQLWGDFVGDVSILDLLFNTGERARDFLKSQKPSRVVA